MPSPAAGSGSNLVRVLAGVFLALCLGFLAAPASAQQDVLRSGLAGVTFPVPAQIWFPDPRRTQATTINDIAADAGKSCTTYEFSIWYVAANETADIRTRTEAAITEAGWALELAAVPTDEQIAYLARRATDELVMAWLIRPEELGLLLCVAGPPAAPRDEGAAGAVRVDDETRAADGTPVPRGNPAREGVEQPVEPAPGLPAAPFAEAPGALVPTPGLDGIAGVIDAVPLAPPAETVETPPATPAPEAAATTPAAATSGDGSRFSVGLFLLAAVLGGAAFLLLRLGTGAMVARTGARWPTAIATVVYSQVASEERKTRAGRPGTRYVPVVAYEYEVEGTLYRAARLRFGDTSSPELSDARHTTDRFPVGAGIEVHYNPARPAEAVVETGHDTVNASLIAGVALAVLAVASLLSAIG
ncbi:MAG: DUF3592 domain-containing protein [Bauldia sp.]|nr:DUF3592 domain-containing protein [Bauldia sp.]